jgi:hypothetical protein
LAGASATHESESKRESESAQTTTRKLLVDSHTTTEEGDARTQATPAAAALSVAQLPHLPDLEV